MARRSAAIGLIAVGASMLQPLVAAPVSLADVARQEALTCSDGLPTIDGRVFPEPQFSGTYTEFSHFVCGMVELETTYGDLLESEVIGQSEGGNDQYVIRMTDETVTTPKQDLLIYSSLHGNEIGAREGAVRQIEDMVDPSIMADEGWVQQTLDEFVIHWFFPNPDGWVNGETGTYSRANSRGTDLNRNYSNAGFIANQPESEQESVDAADYIRARAGNWYLGTDNHGQGGDTYAAAGLQIVGQFDFQKSETLARFADGISDEMAATGNGVLTALDQLNSASGADLGPYHWGTLYDMLGYSASGSMIDWYNAPGGIEGVGFATELTAGQQFNINLHPSLLNQVHVDSIRAINATMFKNAIDPVQFTFPVGGTAAYVHDPRRITNDDANGRGYEGSRAGEFEEVPYDVSRMQFLEDLNKYADNPLAAVRVPDVLSGAVDLAAFDSLILANDAMPESFVRHDAAGEPIGTGADGAESAWFGALRTWVEAGGNLIVTDAALAEALPGLGLIDESAIYMDFEYVGAVQNFDESHPLAAGLRGVASQTYDTVPLGMNFGNPDSAPNWKIDQAPFFEAGGVQVGSHAPNDTTRGTTSVIYGEIPVGSGTVRVLGALLPDPTEEFFHPFGLLNYAVTYTGYTLLENMLVWENPAQVEGEVVAPTPDPEPAPAPDPEPIDEDLPATGGGIAVIGLGLALFATSLRRGQ